MRRVITECQMGCRPSNACGWVGEFRSFSPSGVSKEDVRFQDVWLRTFQERTADGKFRMKMIRRADQAAKSWPRAGAAPSFALPLDAVIVSPDEWDLNMQESTPMSHQNTVKVQRLQRSCACTHMRALPIYK